ncbi:copper homeostasis protein CutC [Flavobacterium sp. SUN052]|uniref:copper homeostasis protein CutC n=1 Tax=Flavobacterium sp. SUN052 TaxID=3002441 RepID=UPI00237E7F48|nr:copper homeostasis protein CutC [Flavobacterium sp. SUN052]MEC4004668.1 copper homeostasis protein CutC [Flavobacterium sp. SUN052]
MNKLEIACFNLQSAVIAQENGADRVELCNEITVGGTTPDFKLVEKVRQLITIDLNVMIRPRGGNFVYSNQEFNQMKSDILAFKKLEVNGFVFGVLNENKAVNKTQNLELVALAHPIPCTFHRAFDEVLNVFQSLEDIIECGFQSILTSGQKSNVVDGITILSELVTKANNRITIMPGGGLRAENCERIRDTTKAVYFHSSAIIDNSEIANAVEINSIKMKLNQKL